ncbi:MAG TPA: hypothetical protein VFI31_15795 [Pirellulales bacterium]|nr:hypothetical protein [Pirellulales bacterium]
MRRYPLRLRFSLRTFLLGITVFAGCCAWFAAARQRADSQDAILAVTEASSGTAYFERSGPIWLDLVGLDRFRRRITGIEFGLLDEEHRASFQQLSQRFDLLRLRFLSIKFSPYGAGEQERRVNDLLGVVGKLTQLKELQLEDLSPVNERLQSLGNLADLRYLSLSSCDVDSPSVLACLPALAELEELAIADCNVCDRDLSRLTAFPRLKSLNLSGSHHLTGAGLMILARLESLEELKFDETMLSASGLEALCAARNLRSLYVNTGYYSLEPCELKLNDGDVTKVYGRDVEDLRRALSALRQSKPELAVRIFSNIDDWYARHHDKMADRGISDYFREQMKFPFLDWSTHTNGESGSAAKGKR